MCCAGLTHRDEQVGAMPRSLFWRMVLLLVALTIAVLAMVLLFRQDRAGLIARNFSEPRSRRSRRCVTR